MSDPTDVTGEPSEVEEQAVNESTDVTGESSKIGEQAVTQLYIIRTFQSLRLADECIKYMKQTVPSITWSFFVDPLFSI